MSTLERSTAFAWAQTAGREAGIAHLRLYMPASVGDVVHQEVLRQGRRGHDRHLVVEGYQVARQLPVVRSVGLVQDLGRQRVTSRNHRLGQECPMRRARLRLTRQMLASPLKRHRGRKQHDLSCYAISRDSKAHGRPRGNLLLVVCEARRVIAHSSAIPKPTFLMHAPRKENSFLLGKNSLSFRTTESPPPPLRPAPSLRGATSSRAYSGARGAGTLYPGARKYIWHSKAQLNLKHDAARNHSKF